MKIDGEVKLMIVLLVLAALFWAIEPKEWPKAGTLPHDHRRNHVGNPLVH